MDPRMATSLAAVGAFGLLFTAVGATQGARVALSVGLGAAIAAANLYVLARIVAGLVVDAEEAAPPTGASPAKKGNAGIWGVIAVVKMGALFFAVWFLMNHGLASPLSLAIGYGALPIGVAIGSLVSDKTAKEPDP
jgi:hypothetical protein